MSNRTLRVNALVQRELSDILRKRYQSEAVTITVAEVRVSFEKLQSAVRDGRIAEDQRNLMVDGLMMRFLGDLDA